MIAARIVRRLHLDAVAELGESEAEDLVGATLTLIRARVVDIFGAETWDEPRAATQPELSDVRHRRREDYRSNKSLSGL